MDDNEVPAGDLDDENKVRESAVIQGGDVCGGELLHNTFVVGGNPMSC